MARPQVITKEEILEQALALFLRHGIAGTEMKQIADACGISRMTLYRYFDSKEAMAFLLAQRVLQDYFACLEENMVGTNGYARIKNALTAMVVRMRQSPEKVRLLDDFDCFFSDQYPETPNAKQYTDFLRENPSPLQAALAQGQQDGSIRAGLDTDFEAQLAMNLLLGVAQRVLPRQAILHSEQGYGPEYLDGTLHLILDSLQK